MALQGISQQEHHRLMERLKLRGQGNREQSLKQQEKLSALFGKYNKLISELESTISEYRRFSAPVSARVIFKS